MVREFSRSCIPKRTIPPREQCMLSYVPDNLISAEVYGLIAAWEASTLTTPSLADCMELDVASVSVSQTMFEPLRCPNDSAPPKRFYRTFWRSAARRILELSNTQPMETDPETSL